MTSSAGTYMRDTGIYTVPGGGHTRTPFAPLCARGLTRAPRAAQELLEGCARVPRSGDPRLALWRHVQRGDVRQLLDRNLRAEGVARKRRRDLAHDGRRSRKARCGIDGRLAERAPPAAGGGQAPPDPPQRLPAPPRASARKGKVLRAAARPGRCAPRPRCRAPQ